MKKSSLIDSTRQNDALTANGAVTHSTSLSACVDMFFLAGASRRMEEQSIITIFERARAENKILAYKILFWARDCRGGAGEKRFFQVIGKHLAEHYSDDWDSLAIHIEEYGYWKDLFVIETPSENTLNYLKHQLEEHPNANLLAKFFPRKGKWFVAMHKYLKMRPKLFRKYLVSKSETVENAMCSGEWSSIDYSRVPSVAMNLYRNAFGKHDGARFEQFNQDVLDGKDKVNASVLFPHLLYQAIQEGQNETAVEAQWKSLPDYMADSTERILPLCDVSGSMSGLPMDVSVSLGLYIAERNKGIFKDAFMTFSETPEMVYIQGATLAQKMRMIGRSSWGYNTDLQANFELILRSAVRDGISQDEMPTKLLIISDMEFDEASYGRTNLDDIRAKYAASGYELPEIIFWNVNGRVGNVPAKCDEPGIGLVSGFSPAILTAILAGKSMSPADLMLEAVNGERYERITFHIE